jgi:glycosyltransferase involved in cell wall biosynthesis
MISFIVPAHNEEVWIGRCLQAIGDATESVAQSHEVIVVDDASTDATASIAQQLGARVLRVEHRQISATRNAGAREARGEVLIFVDADTLVNGGVVRSVLRSIHEGAVGGGCVPQFEGWLPLWCRVAYPIMAMVVRLFRQPGGACLFCTRRAFEAVGGFSEAHYAAEEAPFVGALKRQGRFVMVPERVITSGRNLRAYSFWTIARVLVRLTLRGRAAYGSREGLDLWYRPQREKSPGQQGDPRR